MAGYPPNHSPGTLGAPRQEQPLHPSAITSFLDPTTLIGQFGLIGICVIIFAETGLLIGFIFPGDTLLIIAGLLSHSGKLDVPIWLTCLAIGLSAFLGGELGYLIGRRAGPRIFERRESGLFSKKNVDRTNAFFERFGPAAVILARFVPVVRTFAPIAAGIGHMKYSKYSLYNIIGALLWGSGVTLLGWSLGFVPPVGAFVEKYIDLILLGAVLIAVVPALFHLIQGAIRTRRMRASEADDPIATLDGRGTSEPDAPGRPAGTAAGSEG